MVDITDIERDSVPDTVIGLVSVILIDFAGADDTIAAIGSLGEMSWPADLLEIIVVDNAAESGSGDRIAEQHPTVRLITAPGNLGFAGGCNLGVAHARGEYVAFLNNDARPHREWITAAVAALRADRGVACVASKVLSWQGDTVDFVDGALTWYGMGYKREAGLPDAPQYQAGKDVLFATGAAMIVRTGVYRSVGGFDERFFMFYEDVDLGWRLNLLGHRVRYVPQSIAYHRHHGTVNRYGSWREEYLLERNALMTAYKNFSAETLARTLPAAMALSVRRSVARTDFDARILDLQTNPGGDDEYALMIHKSLLAGPMAVDYFADNITDLSVDRDLIQNARVNSDRDLMPLMRQAVDHAYPFPSYVKAHADLVAAFGLAGHFSDRRRILVVTEEPLTRHLAPAAIRAWEMASHLSAEHDVVLATTTETSALMHPAFRATSLQRESLHDLEAWCEVIVFQGFLLTVNPWLADSTKVLVADLSDPIDLHNLEHAADQPGAGRDNGLTQALDQQLGRADLLLCASQRQRDFWLGRLAGLGRLDASIHDGDPTAASLISVVPTGVPASPARRTKAAIKGVISGIGPDDKVILWSGGPHDRLDPVTLVDAVARIGDRRGDVKLLLAGLGRPGPAAKVAAEAAARAAALGVLDKAVFFHDVPIAYDEQADYLLDADLGVSCHLDPAGAAFTVRSCLPDFFWAGLPVVTTDGDALADLVVSSGAGRVVAACDVDALVDALEALLDDTAAAGQARAASALLGASMTWDRALEPLAAFCRRPLRAADHPCAGPGRLRPTVEPESAAPLGEVSVPWWRRDAKLALGYLEEGGLPLIATRIRARVRRLLVDALRRVAA